MPTPEIIERVRKLHDELGETQPDPAKAEHVAELRKQIDTVLAEPAHEPHYKSLSDKLLFHYVGFQIDHPKLAASMESIVDQIQKAGI
ncbi:hypothetical protein BH11MYX1_BH11MYX1_55040 [soil metagenome]